MAAFDHEKLDVYQFSLEFVAAAGELIRTLPVGRSSLADQLSRASTSITLNIAEGAGEFSRPEKARFYRMAKRSATECAAILDVCRVLNLTDGKRIETGKAMLLRVVAMLVRMIQSVETGKGTGRHTHTGQTAMEEAGR